LQTYYRCKRQRCRAAFFVQRREIQGEISRKFNTFSPLSQILSHKIYIFLKKVLKNLVNSIFCCNFARFFDV